MKNSATWQVPQSNQSSRPLISGFTQSTRKAKDHLTRWVVHVGGLGIIGALMLIFGYLIYEVMPLFYGADMEVVQAFEVSEPPVDDRKEGQVHAVFDELTQLHVQLHQSGHLTVAERASGWQSIASDWPSVAGVSHVAVDPGNQRSVLLYQDGQVQWRQFEFAEVFDDHNNRSVEFRTQMPVGEEWMPFTESGLSLSHMSFRANDEALLVAATPKEVFETPQIRVKQWIKEQAFLSDEVFLEADGERQYSIRSAPVKKVFIGPDLRWLYVVYQDAEMQVFDLNDQQKAIPYRVLTLSDVELTSVEFLLGSFSLLVGDAKGQVTQWMPVRDDQNQHEFTAIRSFQLSDQPIVTLLPESRRKGFFAVDALGYGAYVNSTAENIMLETQLAPGRVDQMALSPRGDYLWVQQANQVNLFAVDNPHPDVSLKSLWGKVWYEGYQEPEYLWQSSASNNDFEPKFSLMPLSFGTLKAAFYAMLLAMPLAICGAIFTAYFMAPALRTKVKPMIEMMEALPTVILGFLAGLWLAPLVEQKLPGIVVMLLVLPIFFLLVAYVYSCLPKSVREYWVRPGWEPVWLVPVVVFGVWLSMAVSDPIQAAFFGGDVRMWLTQDLGIDFDQRNALVVGFVMGFAVIPTIFSIAEDAIFAVPKHLSYGSLALGATSWQTLVRVVLPTASPGIFSAVMIGFGRAIGETMIVLMATGNTPIMDMNIFEGFRTLSANIAVEMPEAEVESSHYRILFLAALVLLAFTFVLNTTAELIRQNLRRKYGSL